MNYTLADKIKNAFCLRVVLPCLVFLPAFMFAQQKATSLKISTRGVYETKISLLPLTGEQALKPVSEVPGVHAGSSVTLLVPAALLPGEFILRFDYMQTRQSTSYPVEKHLFIGSQDIELSVNPAFIHNADSIQYQTGEIENTSFMNFTRENEQRKQKIAVLHNFLVSYDQPGSKLFKEAVKEYEKRRKAYNSWLTSMEQKDKNSFISNIYRFHYMPAVDWQGNQSERLQTMIRNYFDMVDFKQPLLIHTTDLQQWTTRYVNLYGELATSVALRDSLMLLAATNAIEKARTGHPVIYGWMIDYFYEGFEKINLQAGIQMLEKYINDPAAISSKKLSIIKRIEGMKTLVQGSLAPDFNFTAEDFSMLKFRDYHNSKYKLILFWAAGCDYCKSLIGRLYPYYTRNISKKLLDVFAISVDDNNNDITLWSSAIQGLRGWKHVLAKGGFNSVEANAYFVLGTPVMILVDGKTNKILAFPSNEDELASIINE